MPYYLGEFSSSVLIANKLPKLAWNLKLLRLKRKNHPPSTFIFGFNMLSQIDSHFVMLLIIPNTSLMLIFRGFLTAGRYFLKTPPGELTRAPFVLFPLHGPGQRQRFLRSGGIFCQKKHSFGTPIYNQPALC